MTRYEARKNAEVMQAWAEGKPVEFRRRNIIPGDWTLEEEGSGGFEFDFERYEYRIKTGPRRFWLAQLSESTVIASPSLECVRKAAKWGGEIIEVQEVLK